MLDARIVMFIDAGTRSVQPLKKYVPLIPSPSWTVIISLDIVSHMVFVSN